MNNRDERNYNARIKRSIHFSYLHRCSTFPRGSTFPHVKITRELLIVPIKLAESSSRRDADALIFWGSRFTRLARGSSYKTRLNPAESDYLTTFPRKFKKHISFRRSTIVIREDDVHVEASAAKPARRQNQLTSRAFRSVFYKYCRQSKCAANTGVVVKSRKISADTVLQLHGRVEFDRGEKPKYISGVSIVIFL